MYWNEEAERRWRQIAKKIRNIVGYDVNSIEVTPELQEQLAEYLRYVYQALPESARGLMLCVLDLDVVKRFGKASFTRSEIPTIVKLDRNIAKMLLEAILLTGE